MADAKPPRDVRAWLRILRPEREGCLHTVPDPKIPGDVAAYNVACQLLAAEPAPQPGIIDRISARVLPWLFPELQAEIEP